ncbi:MAG: ABC transporter ATP-binding protein [Clostridia bacterium]|nr:ABC transporter ATP-binding protein [Clostridia bacterium]
MSGDSSIIKTKNLTKRYGGLTAVDGLNLEVKSGEVFGLLGPNGAGKTTTILMLLGLTEPTQGKVSVCGFDSIRQPISVKKVVGYLPDNVGFYSDMTGRENLRYTAHLNGIYSEQAEERIYHLFERVGLEDAANKKVGEYSRGMRQRLGIADVLIKDPKVVILDEPTLGIDPEGVKEMLDLIVDLSRKDGRTILLSSHLLHQVQKICDRVGIFIKGKLLACGPIDALEEQVYNSMPYVIELGVKPQDDKLIALLNDMTGVLDIQKTSNDMIIVNCSNDISQQIAQNLIQNHYMLYHLRLQEKSLEDIYSRYFEGKE